jgi:hypothetical protein
LPDFPTKPLAEGNSSAIDGDADEESDEVECFGVETLIDIVELIPLIPLTAGLPEIVAESEEECSPLSLETALLLC